MNPVVLDEATANAVWDVLAAECGAGELWRQDFVLRAAGAGLTEYRFMGSLGFGGKLYAERGGFRVGCYPEDETPQRLAAMERANRLLATR